MCVWWWGLSQLRVNWKWQLFTPEYFSKYFRRTRTWFYTQLSKSGNLALIQYCYLIRSPRSDCTSSPLCIFKLPGGRKNYLAHSECCVSVKSSCCCCCWQWWLSNTFGLFFILLPHWTRIHSRPGCLSLPCRLSLPEYGTTPLFSLTGTFLKRIGSLFYRLPLSLSDVS